MSSPNCSGVGGITIVVRFPGGRCTDRVTITAQRGATVDWTLLGVLDTTKPLTVTLVPVAGGPPWSSTPAHPASGEVQFVVPASLGNGRYRIVESGTGTNGKRSPPAAVAAFVEVVAAPRPRPRRPPRPADPPQHTGW
ncbi:MAG: hypothetical protein IPL07_22305 [Acidimicrobiaceae bacterium]|nr:hypothetical protein [Acidimicrobiaceae bacterium]